MFSVLVNPGMSSLHFRPYSAAGRLGAELGLMLSQLMLSGAPILVPAAQFLANLGLTLTAIFVLVSLLKSSTV